MWDSINVDDKLSRMTNKFSEIRGVEKDQFVRSGMRRQKELSRHAKLNPDVRGVPLEFVPAFSDDRQGAGIHKSSL